MYLKALALVLVLLLPGMVSGQTARYRGRTYTPQSFPRATWCPCSMCQSIRAQWSASTPRPTYTPTTSYQSLPSTITPTASLQPQTSTPTQYRIETRYRTETYQVKHCNGRTCYYTTETRSVPYQVRVSIPTVAPKREPLKLQESPSTKFDPTPPEVVSEMVRLLNLTSRDYFADLGCGDGRVVIEAAKQGATSVGIEIEPSIAALARKAVQEAGVTAKIHEGDASRFTYGNVTAVAMYLYPDIMEDLVPKLKPGTRVVSYAHEIPMLKNSSFTVGEHTIYYAVVPNKFSLFGLEVSEDPVTPIAQVQQVTFGL